MAREKMPGIYMIHVKPAGKVYIGQSKDVIHRINLYKWAATTTKDYEETKRPVVIAIREYGLENVEFVILEQGPAYKNDYTRTQAEIRYIKLFNSTDPQYGYNESTGGELGSSTPRPQEFLEKARRAKPMYLYDTKTDMALYYMMGAKAAGAELGFGKDIASHAVLRGCLVRNRYYIIPADKTDRHKQLERRRKYAFRNLDKRHNKNISRTVNKFREYEKIVKRVDEIDKDACFLKPRSDK